MNSTLERIWKGAKKSPFSKRYIKLLRSNIAAGIRDSVTFNIIEWQWKKGELREDRQFSRDVEGEAISREAFQRNEEAIMANKSDALALSQMLEFKKRNSMDMDEVGEAWFVYVTEGGDRP